VKKKLTLTLFGAADGSQVVTELNGLKVITLGNDANNLVNLTTKINDLIVEVDQIRGELLSIHSALANTLMRFVPLETVDEPKPQS
jgi:hypothetical protein